MCPMAKTCKGMMGKPFSGLLLIVPGIVFILVGALILVEPKVLVWLMAAVSIFAGIGMLMLASFIRKVGGRLRRAHG